MVVFLVSDINIKFCKVILEKFKNYDILLFLGIDLVVCGIDIDNLEYVINFDIVCDKEIYIYCFGWIGCMGKEGCVIIFVIYKEEFK